MTQAGVMETAFLSDEARTFMRTFLTKTGDDQFDETELNAMLAHMEEMQDRVAIQTGEVNEPYQHLMRRKMGG